MGGGAFIFTPSTPLSRRRQAGRRVETLPPLCNRDCVNSAFCLLTKRLFNQTSVSTEPAFVAAGHMFLPLPKLNLPEFEILHVRRIHPPPPHPSPSATTFFQPVNDVIVEAAWGDDGGDGDRIQRGQSRSAGRRGLELPGLEEDSQGSSRGSWRGSSSPQDASEAVRERGADRAASLCGESRSDPEGGLSHVSEKESRRTSPGLFRLFQI